MNQSADHSYCTRIGNSDQKWVGNSDLEARICLQVVGELKLLGTDSDLEDDGRIVIINLNTLNLDISTSHFQMFFFVFFFFFYIIPTF